MGLICSAKFNIFLWFLIFDTYIQDTCMGVLSASHDMHIGRILKREDEARGVETKRFQETMAK